MFIWGVALAFRLYSSIKEFMIKRNWKDSEILKSEKGFLYVIDHDFKQPHTYNDLYLHEYDLENHKWTQFNSQRFKLQSYLDGVAVNLLHYGWDVRNHCFIGKSDDGILLIDLETQQEEILPFNADRAFLTPKADKILLLKCTRPEDDRQYCKARMYDRYTKDLSKEWPIEFP